MTTDIETCESSVLSTLKIIIDNLAPERIFHKDRFFLIVLSNKSQRPLSDYKCIIENNVEGIKECYTLLFANELDKHIDAGNLFFSSFCTAENLAFDACQSSFPLPLTKRIESTINRVAFEFYNGYKRAQAFFKGAVFYLNNENYSFSLFMLHQAMEQGLRTIILTISNQDVRSHSLMELKPHLKRCAPNLLCFFSHINDGLMLLLEGAYSGCRYINNYHVAKEDVELLNSIVQGFLTELKRTFESMLESFAPKQFSINNEYGR
jgi:HEPN domain-containing protein